jgi:predicted adenylyl cyclase CyaB
VATNVEIKARVKDVDLLRDRIEAISDAPCQEICQEDTFFPVPKGRLKLRILAPERGELIYYDRKDARDPKPSRYLTAETTDPAALGAVLTNALGFKGIVRKRRLLYRVGKTRIHLDDVEGLGSFLELEVVLDPGESVEGGEKVAREIMTRLGVEPSDLVGEAYIDLLKRATNRVGGA